MKDRIAQNPNRIGLTDENGVKKYYTLSREDNPTQEGTKLNKANLMNDDTATSLGLTENSTINDALEIVGDGIANKVGNFTVTPLNDLGDNWLLCDGTPFDETVYPKLAELYPQSWDSFYIVDSGNSDNHRSFTNGDYFVSIYYSNGYPYIKAKTIDCHTTYGGVAISGMNACKDAFLDGNNIVAFGTDGYYLNGVVTNTDITTIGTTVPTLAMNLPYSSITGGIIGKANGKYGMILIINNTNTYSLKSNSLTSGWTSELIYSANPTLYSGETVNNIYWAIMYVSSAWHLMLFNGDAWTDIPCTSIPDSITYKDGKYYVLSNAMIFKIDDLYEWGNFSATSENAIANFSGLGATSVHYLENLDMFIVSNISAKKIYYCKTFDDIYAYDLPFPIQNGGVPSIADVGENGFAFADYVGISGTTTGNYGAYATFEAKFMKPKVTLDGFNVFVKGKGGA